MRTSTPYPSSSQLDMELDFPPLDIDVRTIVFSASEDEADQTRPTRSRTREATSEDRFNTLRTGPELVMDKSLVGLCGVCGDELRQNEAVLIPNCGHVFCAGCLRSYVLVKIQERQYPISCPGCVAIRYTENHLEEDILFNLQIGPKETNILVELQISLHTRTVECSKCNQKIKIGRQDYFDNPVLTCTTFFCENRWCRDCGKEVLLAEVHHCKNKKLDRLMRRKGWRYCPGCRTPIQKETGCNHMTCGAPGCRVHFCYKCGDMIFDMSRSRSDGLSAAISAHYSRCRQYPILSGYTLARAIPSRCNIQ